MFDEHDTIPRPPAFYVDILTIEHSQTPQAHYKPQKRSTRSVSACNVGVKKKHTTLDREARETIAPFQSTTNSGNTTTTKIPLSQQIFLEEEEQGAA